MPCASSAGVERLLAGVEACCCAWTVLIVSTAQDAVDAASAAPRSNVLQRAIVSSAANVVSVHLAQYMPSTQYPQDYEVAIGANPDQMGIRPQTAMDWSTFRPMDKHGLALLRVAEERDLEGMASMRRDAPSAPVSVAIGARSRPPLGARPIGSDGGYLSTVVRSVADGKPKRQGKNRFALLLVRLRR